jgi:hypothetical protein
MAIEKVIDIKVQGNADEAVGSLRSQLRQAQADVAALSEKFGVTSQQAVEAAKRAGELKDKIGDAKALTDAFNPDAKFKALSSSLAGVAGGFAAVQGGMALFGAESKEVEKTLLKVQSAMALSAGLQQIGESIDSFKQLGAVIKSLNVVQGINNFIQTGSITLKKEDVIATAAQATATVAATTATSAATMGMKLLRLAIIGTGIGALVVGLVSLYQNFDKVKEAVLNFIPGLASVGKFIGGIVDSVTDFVGATSDASRALDTMREAADKSLASNKKYLEQQGDQLDEFTKKKIDAKNRYLEALKDEGNSEKDRIELAKRLNRELAAADKERQDEKDKKAKEAKEKSDAVSKQNQKEALAQAKKDANELLKLQEEAAKKSRDLQIEESYKAQDDIEAARKENADRLLSDQELKLQNENEAYKIKYDNAVKNGYDTEELERQHLNNINDINLTAQDKAYQQQKEASDKEMALDIAIKDAKRAALDTGLNILMQFAGKNKTVAMGILAIQKGLAIADVVVGAAKGIAAAQVALASVPAVIGIVPNPMYAVQAAITAKSIALTKITAGTSIASILAAAIGQASSISGGGSGGGSSSGGGGGAMGGGSAPQFNVVGNSGVNQLAGVMSTNQQQPPIKTYVVASDVTSGQSLDRNIIRNASLG